MNNTRRTRRLAAAVCALLLALFGASPAIAAIASVPHYGQPVVPRAKALAHTVTVGGMPGWQITLIAVGAALLAAIVAVAADRALAARRHQTAPSL
jgi:hypothetical protein